MKNRRDGFTLMELLVCIGIIIMLVGAMIPTYFSVREAARRRDALNTIEQVETALRAYWNDNRELPPELGRNQEFDESVVNVLGGANPKGFCYLDFTTNELVNGLYDPWGQRLWISLDGGANYATAPKYDGKVEPPGHGTVNRSVAVWSKARKNGIMAPNDPGDDVCSWK